MSYRDTVHSYVTLHARGESLLLAIENNVLTESGVFLLQSGIQVHNLKTAQSNVPSGCELDSEHVGARLGFV